MVQAKVFAFTDLDELEREFNDWSANAGVAITEVHWSTAYDTVKCVMLFTLLVVFNP